MRAALLIPLLLPFAAGCAAPRGDAGAPQGIEYPGTLQPATAMGADFVWRQSIVARWEGGERGFDAAVQVRGGTLTVMGLSPIGQPGFVVQYTADGAVELEDHVDLELPFPPEFILLDVQRVFFPQLSEGAPLADGVHGRIIGEELVGEVWSAGRPLERSFQRTDGQPPGEIHVAYEWSDAFRLAPARATLVNGWFGYRLEVVTHDETILSGGE